jgi:hypothetical protein
MPGKAGTLQVLERDARGSAKASCVLSLCRRGRTQFRKPYPNGLDQSMLDEQSLQVSWAARSVHVACIQHTAAQRQCERDVLKAASPAAKIGVFSLGAARALACMLHIASPYQCTRGQ